MTPVALEDRVEDEVDRSDAAEAKREVIVLDSYAEIKPEEKDFIDLPIIAAGMISRSKDRKGGKLWQDCAKRDVEKKTPSVLLNSLLGRI